MLRPYPHIKCVDMASACDIPRLVQCVLCTKTLLRWLLRDFDGYSDGPSTKCVEKERRAMKVQSSDIYSMEDMPVTICQERFFKEQGYISLSVHWLITWKGLVFK